MLGPLSHEKVLRLQQSAAIAVLPSRDEALPMFLLEAMARGCAVVGSTVGEIPQLFSKGAGLLVAPGNIDDLARALEELCTDANLRANTAALGYQRVSAEYSSDSAAKRLVSVWKSVADTNRYKLNLARRTVGSEK